MVDYFVKGGPFMWPLLLFLLIGLAFALERFWTLTRATIDSRRFNVRLRDALEDGGVEKAIDVCANTRGPIASVIQAGLTRVDRGLEYVEKAIMSSGTIEMAFLERNLIWFSRYGQRYGRRIRLNCTGKRYITVAGSGRYFRSIADHNVRTYRGDHYPVLP